MTFETEEKPTYEELEERFCSHSPLADEGSAL